jgi:uncharacterized membrane protein
MLGMTVSRPASTALGAAVILIGLRQRGGTRVLSLAAGAGLLAHASLAKAPHRSRRSSSLQPLSITRVTTVGSPRGELYTMWRDPQTLAKVFGSALCVEGENEGRIRVQANLPAGRALTWTSRLVAQEEGSSLVWRTDPGAAVPHEMFVRLRDARPAELGTEVTLGFAPLSDSGVAKAFLRLTHAVDQAVLTTVLHRFKSLAETAEMPTLSHNPAGRPRAFATV